LPIHILASTVVIFPGVVHEGEACIHRFLDDPAGLGFAGGPPKMGAAEAEGRDRQARLPEGAPREFSGSFP
jgi:hypothetical protein